MKELIISELERYMSRKKTLISIIFLMFINILWGLFMSKSGIGFYDANIITKLDSLNFSQFILRDLHVILLFIICPMIFIDSFNGENAEGAYRMVALRSYSRMKLMISKLISGFIILVGIVLLLFIVNSLFGMIFLPEVTTTKIINHGITLGVAKAIFYNIKFYMLELLILLAAMIICFFISTISFNTIVAFILTDAFFILSLYIIDDFDVFLMNTKYIFDVLKEVNVFKFYLIPILCILFGILLSSFVWTKRDYIK